MKYHFLKRLVCVGLLSGSFLIGNVTEAGVVTDRMPLQCYADHQVNTYNSPGAAKRAGYISANVDKIKILEVRGDGWCRGSYPGSGGKTVTRWFRITDVCADAGYTNRSANVRGNQTVYRTRSGGATIGSVSNNESVIVVADNGNRAQIVYRLDNGTGYKMGWGPSSAVRGSNTNHNPQGAFESYGTLNNALRVIGWAKDDDDLNHKVRVHVYIGGTAGDANAYSKEIRADKASNACPGHGFDETLWNIPDRYCGRQTVRLYALNDVGGGSFQEIGAKTIDIPPLKSEINQYRKNALNAAREMVEVRWTAPCDFVTWCSSKGVYNRVVDVNGTVDTSFRKGRTYTGIPYSMKNRSYTKNNFVSYLSSHKNKSDYEDYYYKGKKTTKIGIDCSYFVWSAINNSGAPTRIGNNYTTTSTLLNSRLFTRKNYSDMRPGDIFLKTGSHVMILVEKLSNGNCVVYEADAGDSKCSKNTYNPNNLSREGYVGYTFNGYDD